MCDKLVYDLSQEVEGTPNVFVRKDWINILDNQNQNYQNNQCVIDTSQLSNSNKYMSYREAYLAIPMLLTVLTPLTAAGSYPIGDYAIGLKNWFGSVIHSFTLDYNGTTIVQQTPFINMWNIFKLLTSLSYQEITSIGPTIGFYPDTSGSWSWQGVASVRGLNVCNNDNAFGPTITSSFSINDYNQYNVVNNEGGNEGLTARTKWISYDPLNGGTLVSLTAYGTVGITAASCQQVWKSYISKQQYASSTVNGVLQISVIGTVYLRHLHSFFNMVPLLKGVFMKLTMNLNNSSASVTMTGNTTAGLISAYTSTVPVGGVLPILVPSIATGSAWMASGNAGTFNYNLSVGSTCLDNNISSNAAVSTGTLAKSIYLYVPAYTFNPVFEQAYLSNPVKQIKYTDVYQYQILNQASAQNINSLITNGIANIKSVLIIPFFSNNTAGTAYVEYQSPFDPAGCGTTAPMVTIGNFNVQISGQNAIYNTQRYSFEEFNNQLYGQNSVNGGLTDGLASGLINYNDFQNSYCYHYVNVERMLPVEQSVPKSVQIIGTNYSTQTVNLWVFVEYGVEINIDLYTGARV